METGASSDPPTLLPISRRRFLQLTGVGTSLAAGALTLRTAAGRAAAQAATAASNGPAEVTTVPSVCFQCPAGCGITVKVANGRAFKIEGNRLHPINEGRLCPKGQAGLQILYDPDRIKGPLKRAGNRGEGKWTQISWDQAISEVAAKLKEIREKGGAHKVVFMSGRNQGQIGGFIGRFCDAYGTPNNVGHSSICSDGTKHGHFITQGVSDYLGYDWDNTKYLLSFGCGFIEAFRPTTRVLRAFGQMRRGTPVRAKIVQVETRMSVTAAKADEWVPINPGTDLALALAIAHVIVREKSYDEKFLRERTDAPGLIKDGKPWVKREFEETGADGKTKTKYQEYYVWDEAAKAPAVWSTKNLVHEPATAKPALLGEYTVEGAKAKTTLQLWKEQVLDKATPQWAEKITGLPAEDIERLAREFATTKPAVANGERGVSMHTNGAFGRAAVHTLNALVGSIEVPGGVTGQKGLSLKSLPAVKKDKIAEEGLKQSRIDGTGGPTAPIAKTAYQRVAHQIQDGKPYPVEAVLTYCTNPLNSVPDVNHAREAFPKVGLLVSFSPFMDEFSSQADYVLPDPTYLERLNDVPIYPSVGYAVVGLRQPAVQPLFDTRETGTVLIQLAKSIGGTVGESFPWNDYEEVLKVFYQGLFDSKSGSITATNFDGWWAEFKRAGVWKNPPYKFDIKGALKTPSGRFEFYSLGLKKKLEDVAQKVADKSKTKKEDELEKMLKDLQVEARAPVLYLPHYEAARFVGDAALYPLYLNTYKLMTHSEGRTANVPALQKILGPHVSTRWDSWVEINPDTARRLGIRHGDPVWVESVKGRIQTWAVLYEGAMPNVVNIPFELGRLAYGRWAKGRGVNPNEILVTEEDKMAGDAAFFSTRVKVYRAEGKAAPLFLGGHSHAQRAEALGINGGKGVAPSTG